MANTRANIVTGVGLLFSLVLLAASSPLALPAAALIITGRVIRKMKDDQIEREERENYNDQSRRSEAMNNNLPVLQDWGQRSMLPYGSSFGLYNTPTILTTSPETELARLFPKRAAKVLERQSLHQTSVDLANSASVTEFTMQGRGSHVRITHRSGFLGFKVDQIDFHIRPD